MENATVLSVQFRQQRSCLLQIRRVKPFGEPPVDLSQEMPGCCAFALALPEAAEAQRRPQLYGSGLLAAGKGDGLLKAPLSLGGHICCPLTTLSRWYGGRVQEHLPLEAI